MKRFHVGMRVEDLEASAKFYRALFGAEPCVKEDDYAKWMLEDPRVNFSISTRCDTSGDLHMGIQVESEAELTEVSQRLRDAQVGIRETPGVTCCYHESDKTWSADPQGLPWETFLTRDGATVYGEDTIDKADIERMQAGKSCRG